MNTAKNPMGFKRICTDCGGRFYDLNKRPIICPSCETEFTGEIKAKRRGRVAAEVKKDVPVQDVAPQKNKEVAAEEDMGVEVISLDDAKAAEGTDNKTLVEEDTLNDIPDLSGDVANNLEDDTLLVNENET